MARLPEIETKVRAVSEKGQAGAQDVLTVEVTPDMAEAGVRELAAKHFGEPYTEIVTDVFIAMLWAMRSKSPTRNS